MTGHHRCRSCGKPLVIESGDEIVELRAEGSDPDQAASGGPLCKSCYANILDDPSFPVVREFKTGPNRVVYVPDPSYFSVATCRYATDSLQPAGN